MTNPYPEQKITVWEVPIEKPQRQWVELTLEEVIEQANKELYPRQFALGALWAKEKLKEKNNG